MMKFYFLTPSIPFHMIRSIKFIPTETQTKNSLAWPRHGGAKKHIKKSPAPQRPSPHPAVLCISHSTRLSSTPGSLRVTIKNSLARPRHGGTITLPKGTENVTCTYRASQDAPETLQCTERFSAHASTQRSFSWMLDWKTGFCQGTTMS